MSKDYKMLKQIEEQTNGLPDNFISALKRMSTRLDERKCYASGLSTSVTIFLAAELCGLTPKLILGTIAHENVSYSTAWVEIDEKVFDLAVYGDTKYNPYVRDRQELTYPQLNLSYLETTPVYYPRQFSDLYDVELMREAVGDTFYKYAEENPYFDLIRDVCYILGISETPDNLKRINEMAKTHIIEDGRPPKRKLDPSDFDKKGQIDPNDIIKQDEKIVKPLAKWLHKS